MNRITVPYAVYIIIIILFHRTKVRWDRKTPVSISPSPSLLRSLSVVPLGVTPDGTSVRSDSFHSAMEVREPNEGGYCIHIITRLSYLSIRDNIRPVPSSLRSSVPSGVSHFIRSRQA